MFDLFLLRGRGIEAMLGISPFEIDEFQVFADSKQSDFSGNDKKLLVPPFESEALKDVAETSKAAPENEFIRFELSSALMILGFVAFELVCFLLVLLLID